MQNIKISTAPVIILLGGKGSRFSDLSQYPKQLAKINQNNLLINIILKYKNFKKNFFILPLGYKSNFFKNFFRSKEIKKYKFNIFNSKNIIKFDKKKCNILYFDAGKKISKIQRIKKSLSFISAKYFYLTYGDGVANLNIKESYNLYKKNKKFLVSSYKINSNFGHIIYSKNKKVKNFIEKPVLPYPINIGYYIFNTDLFKLYSKNTNDLEKDFLPKISKKKMLFYFQHKGFFFNIDSKNDLRELKIKKKGILKHL